MWRSIDESEREVVLRGLPALGARRRPLRLSPALLTLALQRLISWSGALTAHLVAAALLISLWVEARRDDDSLVAVSLHRGNAGEQGKVVEAPKAPEAPKEQPKPETPAPEPPKVEPTPEPPKPDPVVEKPKAEPAPKPAEAAPSADPAPGAADATPKPATIGGGASATGRPAPGGAGGDRDVEKDPTAALQARRAGELDQLRRGSEKDIVVVGGAYDHVEGVLDRLGIPHTIVEPGRLPNLDLSDCKILLVNCHVNYAAYLFSDIDTDALEKQIVALAAQEDLAQKRRASTKDPRTRARYDLELMRTTSTLAAARHRLESLRAGNRAIANLRRFVEEGGYVFSSDWGLSLVEKAFPGYVRNGGSFGPRTVTIRPRSSETKHPLLEAVFYDLAKGGTTTLKKFRWSIDSSSYLIKIERPADVDVLVESSDIPKHPAVAVTFSPERRTPGGKPEPGKGRVLHILSHFEKQATQQGDYALQSMLLNFMLERVAGSR
jgi:hypothetical protein